MTHLNTTKTILILLAVGSLFTDSASFTLDDGLNAKKLTAGITPAQCPSSFALNLVPSGYPFETHTTTTGDGYILNIFRLQSKGSIQTGKPVVLLQHGLNSDGLMWLINGEQNGLAFILAKAGFDVWIANGRGTRFSRRHIKYQPTQKAYWEFSWDEFASYDIPAEITLIRQVTGVQKLSYIGYSLGAAQMFAALSDTKIRPKVAPYIKQFHALAPVVYKDQTHYPPRSGLKDILRVIKEACTDTGLNYLSIGGCVWDQNLVDYWNNLCANPTYVCLKELVYYNYSPDFSTIDNWSRYGYRVAVFNSGNSENTLKHLAQTVEAQLKNPEAFPKYDYGPAGNLKKYGTKTVPNYDLSLVLEKVRMWVGLGDTRAIPAEVQHIQRSAKNADISTIEIPGWGHETFHLAASNKKEYGQLVNILKED